MTTEELTPADAMLLAYAQIAQPTSAAETFSLAEQSVIVDVFDAQSFRRRFIHLSELAYLWRTADNRFVVTPKGERALLAAIPRKTRDKLRLLYLNEKRLRGGWVRAQ